MESNSGMGFIKVIILTVIIAMFVAGGVYFARMQYNQARTKTIKTNMLLVEWKVKEYESKQKVEGKETEYIGTKVSEMQQDTNVKLLIEKGIIPSDAYDKYYVLLDSDLEKLTLEISNESNSYYIVNYETNDILITSGCKYSKDKVLYRLSDIEAEN